MNKPRWKTRFTLVLFLALTGFEQALRKYRAACGARNTGVVDGDTIDSLGLNPASFTR